MMHAHVTHTIFTMATSGITSKPNTPPQQTSHCVKSLTLVLDDASQLWAQGRLGDETVKKVTCGTPDHGLHAHTTLPNGKLWPQKPTYCTKPHKTPTIWTSESLWKERSPLKKKDQRGGRDVGVQFSPILSLICLWYIVIEVYNRDEHNWETV